MGKARVYGKYMQFTPNNRRDLRYIKKTARNRERAMPSLVAGRERTAAYGEKSEK